jgi:hypothetical protein
VETRLRLTHRSQTERGSGFRWPSSPSPDTRRNASKNRRRRSIHRYSVRGVVLSRDAAGLAVLGTMHVDSRRTCPWRILPRVLADDVVSTYFSPTIHAENNGGSMRNGANGLVDFVRAHHVLPPEELSRLIDPEMIATGFRSALPGIRIRVASAPRPSRRRQPEAAGSTSRVRGEVGSFAGSQGFPSGRSNVGPASCRRRVRSDLRPLISPELSNVRFAATSPRLRPWLKLCEAPLRSGFDSL